MLMSQYVPPRPAYVNVERDGRLLFKYDNLRGLIEIQVRGEKYLIDLATVSQEGGHRRQWDNHKTSTSVPLTVVESS